MRTAARSCATALGCRPGQAKNRLWSKHVFQTVVDVQGFHLKKEGGKSGKGGKGGKGGKSGKGGKNGKGGKSGKRAGTYWRQ